MANAFVRAVKATYPDSEEEFRWLTRKHEDIFESAIRNEAIETNRDPDLEAQSYRDKELYYFRPSVGEIHEEELRNLKKQIIRSIRTFEESNEKFAEFKSRAEELVRQWAEEEGRDPDEQIRILRKSGIYGLGRVSWPRERTRALWTYFNINP